jgi:hypothetical protein
VKAFPGTDTTLSALAARALFWKDFVDTKKFLPFPSAVTRGVNPGSTDNN